MGSHIADYDGIKGRGGTSPIDLCTEQKPIDAIDWKTLPLYTPRVWENIPETQPLENSSPGAFR